MKKSSINKEELVQEIDEICSLAMKEGKLHIALKAKELLAKLCLNKKSKLEVKDLTNEELEEMIREVESELI